MSQTTTEFREQTGVALALIAQNHRYKARLADLATLLDEGDPCAVLDRIAFYLVLERNPGDAANIRAVSDTLRQALAILQGDPEPPACPEPEAHAVAFQPNDDVLDALRALGMGF